METLTDGPVVGFEPNRTVESGCRGAVLGLRPHPSFCTAVCDLGGFIAVPGVAFDALTLHVPVVELSLDCCACESEQEEAVGFLFDLGARVRGWDSVELEFERFVLSSAGIALFGRPYGPYEAICSLLKGFASRQERWTVTVREEPVISVYRFNQPCGVQDREGLDRILSHWRPPGGRQRMRSRRVAAYRLDRDGFRFEGTQLGF